jgi:adenosylcobinamide kinase/adenosylcobinamide-phosphate guanylyltransferase
MSVTLITGGARSGKSRYAMETALTAYRRRVFVATAQGFDDEMRDRIARHQQERDGSFHTIESPVDLAGAVGAIPAGTEVALIDCLTVWIGNLLHQEGEDRNWFPQIDAFLEALRDPPCDLLVVTNEVGMGIVPDNPLARRFRDIAGSVNQKIGALADRVVLLVSGVPVTIKGAAI